MTFLCCALSVGWCVGCASIKPRPSVADNLPAAQSANATQPSPVAGTGEFLSALNATVTPPYDWRLDIKEPTKPNVKHYVWISPTGNTAFGVMKFSLPLPLPHDSVLWVFLQEMRKSEGAATLISKIWDRNLRGVRFEAEGGRYRLRTNFTIRGLTGWMTYAGTLRDQPVDVDELREAENAREGTRYGKPQK